MKPIKIPEARPGKSGLVRKNPILDYKSLIIIREGLLSKAFVTLLGGVFSLDKV